MKLGIRAHDLTKGSPNEVASLASKYGFDSVQLVLHKAIEDETGVGLNRTKTMAIADAFKENNIEVAMLEIGRAHV